MQPKIENITATINGDLVTVTAEINGETYTVTMWNSHLVTLDEAGKKAYIRERLLTQVPQAHDAHDLGFTSL